MPYFDMCTKTMVLQSQECNDHLNGVHQQYMAVQGPIQIKLGLLKMDNLQIRMLLIIELESESVYWAMAAH